MQKEDDKSPIENELTLLESAVECGILAPKSKWGSVVRRVDRYVRKLEVEFKKVNRPDAGGLDRFIEPEND